MRDECTPADRPLRHRISRHAGGGAEIGRGSCEVIENDSPTGLTVLMRNSLAETDRQTEEGPTEVRDELIVSRNAKHVFLSSACMASG